ncbi:MAG: fused MFS/spermidine synthase [bacterium]
MSAPRALESRSPVPVWAALCFLLSGAAGLIHEVAWSKWIGYLLGSSLQSVATVTAAFLAGLALGARLLGPRMARRGDPALAYARLEVAIGVLGALMIPLLRALDGPVGMLYRAAGGEGALFATLRVALLLVLLVPPAALMGATLPVLVARCERGALGAGLATLYALNTFGAVAGALAAGFVLLPGVGVWNATLVASALNLAAAALAATQARRSPSPAVTPRDLPAPALASPAARRMLGALFVASGFAALALQLAWFRLYSLVLGSSVHSFAAVLGVYLVGLALGSALVAPFLGRVATPLGFALLQSSLAASVLLVQRADASLPGAMLELGERMGGSWSGLVVAQLGLVVPVILVPCLLLGAIFPVATRLLQQGDGAESTGRAYALNTLGTITGSLVTGFALLPMLGVHGVVALAATISAVVAVLALVLPGAPRPGRLGFGLVAGLTAIALGAALTLPRWDPMLMSLGTYRPFSAMNLMTSFRASGASGDPTREVAAAHRVLYHREGINASVLVSSDLDDRRRWLRVGGKIDAGTGDMLTQVMLGMLPACVADTGARTLIVGHGSGFTAAAALAAGVGTTDIVELEPAVIEASRFFHEGRPDPLDDPRVTVHLEDARTRLTHTRERYDLIVSEPTNPWISGVNALFTTDFYRLVRARLAPQGVFAQWLPVYELSPESFHSLMAAFASSFPDAQLFCMWKASDVILVAAPPARRLSLERLASPALARMRADAGLEQPADVAAYEVGPLANLRPRLAGAVPNTDDRPYVEYRAPRDLVEVGRAARNPHPEVMAGLPRTVRPPAEGPLADWPSDIRLAARARSIVTDLGPNDPGPVLAELRVAGLGALADTLSARHARTVRALREGFLRTTLRERSMARDAAAARDALEGIANEGFATAGDWRLLAMARLEAGDVPGARGAAETAAAGLTGGERVEALVVAGSAALRLREDARALTHAVALQRAAPDDPRGYDLEARIHMLRGERDAARAAVERGLARVPGDASLQQARRALSGN